MIVHVDVVLPVTLICALALIVAASASEPCRVACGGIPWLA